MQATNFSGAFASGFQGEVFPHLRTLYAVAVRLTRNADDAHDLVQEALLRAYGAWHRFEKGSNCRAWLIRILTNNYISKYRRGVRVRNYERSVEALTPCTSEPEVEHDMIDTALSDEVVAALGELPVEFLDVVRLCDLQGLSYREAAQLLHCPIGTIMSRLFRARRLLEDRLSPLAREHGIGRHAA